MTKETWTVKLVGIVFYTFLALAVALLAATIYDSATRLSLQSSTVKVDKTEKNRPSSVAPDSPVMMRHMGRF